jgi:hypothetical protein
MKTRPWHYLVEFHFHDNTDCTQPQPKPGRILMKLWGTGDKPRCEQCQKLDSSLNPDTEHPARREGAK